MGRAHSSIRWAPSSKSAPALGSNRIFFCALLPLCLTAGLQSSSEQSATVHFADSCAFAYDTGGLHGGPGRTGVGGPYPAYDVSRVFFMIASPALPHTSVLAHQQNNCISSPVERISLTGTGLLGERESEPTPVMEPGDIGVVDANETLRVAAHTLSAPPASCVGLTCETIGIDWQVPRHIEPNVTLPLNLHCHNLVTVSSGVLVLAVTFGSVGDDDQYLGVMREPAPQKVMFPHVKALGWVVKEHSPPLVQGTSQHGEAWRLRGHSVTMLLDMRGARTISWWSSAGMHATLGDLPAQGPLTAVLALFQNTATVTALRWFPP